MDHEACIAQKTLKYSMPPRRLAAAGRQYVMDICEIFFTGDCILVS